MTAFDPKHGLGTLVNHYAEGGDSRNAHITPIYETSSFRFPDTSTGAGIFTGQTPGYYYTRVRNPNLDQLAQKIAVLEGLDLLRAQPQRPVEQVVDGLVFASGMAAVSAAVLGRVRAGETVIAQQAIYSASHNLLHDLAPQWGINVAWLPDASPQSWALAFEAHPEARLAYAETPANPTLALTDLAAVAQLAHARGAWLAVDNTMASPYCQRPLTLGADVVIHSTTKYLSGHGLVIGGAVVSTRVEWVRADLFRLLKVLGASASPFDSWLAVMGLKTYELRMQRHCQNALRLARWLELHPAVERVYYPGLESHPQHQLARRQMLDFGGMIAFELRGGLPAGQALMNRLRVATLVVSLGNVDTIISHPASMTHSNMPPQARAEAGISDGLVRLSVGIENVEDLIADFEQALG
jgi:methionine-gamma-lyase